MKLFILFYSACKVSFHSFAVLQNKVDFSFSLVEYLKVIVTFKACVNLYSN